MTLKCWLSAAVLCQMNFHQNAPCLVSQANLKSSNNRYAGVLEAPDVHATRHAPVIGCKLFKHQVHILVKCFLNAIKSQLSACP